MHIILNYGVQTLTGSLPLDTPVDGVYSQIVHVTMSDRETNITLDPATRTCDGSRRCHIMFKPLPTDGSLNLNNSMFIGGVMEFTPYTRSKLITISGFVGCLGVRTHY